MLRKINNMADLIYCYENTNILKNKLNFNIER